MYKWACSLYSFIHSFIQRCLGASSRQGPGWTLGTDTIHHEARCRVLLWSKTVHQTLWLPAPARWLTYSCHLYPTSVLWLCTNSTLLCCWEDSVNPPSLKKTWKVQGLLGTLTGSWGRNLSKDTRRAKKAEAGVLQRGLKWEKRQGSRREGRATKNSFISLHFGKVFGLSVCFIDFF